MMKNSMRFAAFYAMAAIFALSLISPDLKADEKAESFDNSRIKLIKSLSFPNDVMNFVPTIPEDGDRIGLILTKGGVYELKKDLSKTFLIEGINRSKNGGEDYFLDASTNGEIAFENVVDTKAGILNLKKKSKKELEVYGGPLISEDTIFVADGIARTSEVIDFEGNRIKIFTGRDSPIQGKAHKTGFIGNADELLFFDKYGKILGRAAGVYNGNFDISYETGISAIIYPIKTSDGESKSLLSIYDKNGESKNQINLPIGGSNGIAISRDGKFVILSSKADNLLIYLDAESGKQLWRQKIMLGDFFSNWVHPIPISTSGKFFVVHGFIGSLNTKLPIFVVFNAEGKIAGYIDPKSSLVFDHKIIFDPLCSRIFHSHGKQLDIYEILESTGAK